MYENGRVKYKNGLFANHKSEIKKQEAYPMKEKRLTFILIVFALCALYLIFVQASICFVKGEEYTRSAAVQRKTALVVKNYRGRFLDRNLIPLVENKTESYMIDESGKLNTLRGMPIPPMTVRYGEDSLARHLIGYVDMDGRGVCGLEKDFDYALTSGESREVNTVKSADGKVIESMGLSLRDGDNSSLDVILTLDSHIQRIAEDSMRAHSLLGAVVVLDTQTFDVLAMASMPDYDRNNVSSCLDSDGGELINRCISPYNAGSIFKIVTLSGALERGRIRSLYDCPGFIELGGHTFNCHMASGHGRIDINEAFAKSCNCAFYTMGLDMGSDAIADAARSFGLGDVLMRGTLSGESGGNIPSESFGVLDAVNLAIGQGKILLTPLQAANIACIIANGGIARNINAVRAVADRNGNETQTIYTRDEHRVLSQETAETVGTAMRLAVDEGTGKGIKSDSVEIAGKTGTAETGWIKNGKSLVHGWFCGYFPAGNPRYAMAVLAEDGGSGAVSAAPVFKEIAEEIMKIYPLG